MKRFATLVFLIIAFKMSGQDFTLTFSGKNESTNTIVSIDKVHIYNESNGTDTIISGNSFSPGTANFISSPDEENIQFSGYPNPFNREITFKIYTDNHERAVLSMYDMNGKKISSWHGNLSPGENKFLINSDVYGQLILALSSAKITQSLQLICLERSSYSGIELIGLSDNEREKGSLLKSAGSVHNESFRYSIGDKLKFVGYSGTSVSLSLYDAPTSSKSYTLVFGANFFKLFKHKISTSFPSFVNILFSVENENNKGVDYLQNDNFSVLEDNSTVSPTETFLYVKKSNTVPFSLKTVLLLDNSASVKDNLEAIKTAAIKLIENKIEKQQIAVYSFSSNPILMQDFTTSKDSLISAISSITLGFPSTNLYGSIVTAANRWYDTYSTDFIQQGYLLVLTDGDDTQASSTLTSAINAIGEKKTYMIGLGSEINPDALNQLANPGPYYSLNNISELDGVFEEIQNDIIRQSNSFYWLTYMTPKRIGYHQLNLSILDNKNTNYNSYIDGQFNAGNFTDVTYGVYINPSESEPYGIDTLTIDSINNRIKLSVVTYWAEMPPEYKWEFKDENSINTTEDIFDPNSIWVESGENKVFNTELKVIDIKNGYEKTLYIILKSNIPEVEILSVNQVNTVSKTAKANAEIVYSKNLQIDNYGFVWSLSNDPTVETNAGKTEKQYFPDSDLADTLSNLISNTIYYVRAYVSNIHGYSYSGNFILSTETGVPEISLGNIYNITNVSANCYAVLTWDGSAPIEEYGICWDTVSPPGILSNRTLHTYESSFLRDTLDNLIYNKKHYIRAYAKNVYGVGYSSIDSIIPFTTFLKVYNTGSFNYLAINKDSSITLIGDSLFQVSSFGNIKTKKAISGSIIKRSDDDNYLVLQDAYIIKLDEAYDTVWLSTDISTYSKQGSFIELPEGNIAVVRFNGGGKQRFIKLDNTGNIISDYALNYGYNQLENDVQLINDTTLIVTDYDFGELVGWGCCYVAAAIKFYTNGTVEWEKGVYDFTNSMNGANSIKVTDEGDFILTGSAYSYSTQYTKLFVIKTDPEFNKIWATSVGTGKDNVGNYIQITRDGNYIVAGNKNGIKGWLLLISPDGSIIWEKTFTIGASCNFNYVGESPDGGFYVCGKSDDKALLIKTNQSGELY